VFLVAAAVASRLSDLAARRAREAERGRREADLAAELARLLLGDVATCSSRPRQSSLLASGSHPRWSPLLIAAAEREALLREVVGLTRCAAAMRLRRRCCARFRMTCEGTR
jgi:hypothetical protein